MTRHLDLIPQPWSREDIQEAILDDFMAARAAIEDTEGGKLWRRLEDLEDTIWIFQYSVTDLLDEICLFGDRSKNAAFWDRANADEAETHTRAVKRKLFNCTSALMTLVDHARNFQSQSPVPNYSERLKTEFSSPGLHEFMQCLRNYNTHCRIAQTNWSITHNFLEKKREARFLMTKDELFLWDGWSAGARTFIEQSEDVIDLYRLFSAYRGHVQKFYAWHKGAVLEEYASIIRIYQEYKRLHDGINKTLAWNLLISHVPKGASPYQYLCRHLPKDQLNRLLTYSHRSEEQVDALIRIMDMEDFCNEQLRQKLLDAFGVEGERAQ